MGTGDRARRQEVSWDRPVGDRGGPEVLREHSDRAETYRSRVGSVPGPDPDDRAHTAACAFGGATVLLTRNARDFPIDFLAGHGVAVCSADTYLAGLLRRRPAAFVETVQRMAAEKRRPPMSPCDVADGLARAGATRVAAALRRRLGCP